MSMEPSSDNSKITSVVVTVIIALITALSTLMGISKRFVSQDEYQEYKKGRVEAVDHRLDRIELKLDKVIEMKTTRGR